MNQQQRHEEPLRLRPPKRSRRCREKPSVCPRNKNSAAFLVFPHQRSFRSHVQEHHHFLPHKALQRDSTDRFMSAVSQIDTDLISSKKCKDLKADLLWRNRLLLYLQFCLQKSAASVMKPQQTQCYLNSAAAAQTVSRARKENSWFRAETSFIELFPLIISFLHSLTEAKYSGSSAEKQMNLIMMLIWTFSCRKTLICSESLVNTMSHSHCSKLQTAWKSFEFQSQLHLLCTPA